MICLQTPCTYFGLQKCVKCCIKPWGHGRKKMVNPSPVMLDGDAAQLGSRMSSLVD